MKKNQRMYCVLIAFLLMASMLTGCSGKSVLATQPADTGAVANTETKNVYIVTLDVNPSIELTVTDGLVTGALAYSDDGTAIVLSANVIGMTSDAAISAM